MSITKAEIYKIRLEREEINLDDVAVERDEDFENECTWWIFSDSSALGLNSLGKIYTKDYYEFHPDHTQLNFSNS